MHKKDILSFYLLILRILFLLPLLLLISSCNNDNKSEVRKITFRVITSSNDEKDVYITGNNNQLGNWKPGKIKLTRTAKNVWENTFSFNNGEKLEYKFTLGFWQNEALDSLKRIPDNSTYKVKDDTTITVVINNWNKVWKDYHYILSNSIFKMDAAPVVISENWSFIKGNKPEYALTSFDDSKLPRISSLLDEETIKESGWTNEGWFRIHCWVDSSLWGKTVAISIPQTGASEIFFNDSKIVTVGNPDIKNYKPLLDKGWHLITFENKFDQMFAVHYTSFYKNDFFIGHGFILNIKNPESIMSASYNQEVQYISFQIIFSIVPFVLALLHLALFIFYPKNKQNLYYSICLFGFAILAFSFYVIRTTSSPDLMSFVFNFNAPAVIIASLFGLYTAYYGVYQRLPKRAWLFASLGLIIGLVGIFANFSSMDLFIYGFLFIIFSDSIFTLLKARKTDKGATYFSLTGFTFLIIFVAYQMLVDKQFVDPPFGNSLVYVYGVMALIICMSLSLSYNFAKTNKNLEKQIITINKLNELKLIQDQRAKEEEFKRRLLEVDNKRKTEELEEARKLQLSMLPKTLPVIQGYEIAAYIKTATEVGGDYYDFCPGNEDSLIIAVGDATGHGAKAGTMVAATKSLFHALAENNEPLTILKKSTSAIKSMNLHNLYMALTVAKLKDNKFIYANAGMPPMFLFKASNNKTIRLLQKSMPLGSFVDYPYIQEEVELEKDDVILFMSDGFYEAFNNEGDMLGIDNSENLFNNYSSLSPEGIIEKLKSGLEEWNQDLQQDDVTFVVLKKV